MPNDIPLRCTCGKLRGTALDVTPSVGTRIICYCNDCQAFARFLGLPNLTDEWGGTDLFQMAPSRLRMTSGGEALRCVRLSEKGMHRWYCGECKMPVGNTLGPSVPFVGLASIFVDLDGGTRNDVLGKVIAYFGTKSAIGTVPPHVRNSPRLRVIGRSIRLLGTWWITRAGSPSPFFDEETRAPRTEVRILRPEERSALSSGSQRSP